MKVSILLICGFITVSSVFAQVPVGFNYQAILRDENGIVRANEAITLQISIMDQEGLAFYTEVHDATTNEYGLANVVIGQGTTSHNFSTVDWSAGPYYLNITVNGEDLGSIPLLSVPYALFAETGNEGPQGPPGPQGERGLQGEPGDTKWNVAAGGISYPEGYPQER